MPLLPDLQTAWTDIYRREHDLPSRDAQVAIEAKKQMDLLGLDRARRVEELDTEMAPLERQARLEKTAAETLELKDRGARAREAMQARREMIEAEQDLKRELAEMKANAAQGVTPTQEANLRLTAAKERFYNAGATYREMQVSNPFIGKFPPGPILMPSPTGDYQLAINRFGQPWVPGDPNAGLAGAAMGPHAQQSPGSSVTHTNTQAPPTPPSDASATTPPAAARGSAGAPQNSTATPAKVPDSTIPGAGLAGIPNLPPNAVPFAPGQQQRGMANARAAALNSFNGIFANLAQLNANNPTPSPDQGIGDQFWNAKGREWWASAKGKTGLDIEQRFLRESVRGFASLLARAVGHVGVLTELDVNRTEELFPPPGAPAVYTKEKLRYLNDILQGRKTLPFRYEAQTGKLTSPIVVPAADGSQ